MLGKKSRLLLILTIVIGLLSPSMALAETPYQKDKELTRIMGADRYATNIAASSKFTGTSKNSVVIVNGDSYPDGIIAAPLAHSQDSSSQGTSILLHPC